MAIERSSRASALIHTLSLSMKNVPVIAFLVLSFRYLFKLLFISHIMMSSAPLVTHIDRAWFSIWSKIDIKKISVKEVTEPKSFEKAGAKHQDGLYSSDLGAIRRFEVCTTCGLTDISCPGHYGHIELSVPVYHPMMVQIVYQILRMCCLECFHFRLSQMGLKLFLAQLEALNCGFDHLIEELDEIAADMCRDGKMSKDPYQAVLLNQKLTARIKEEKEKNPEFDCQKRPQQRNIVESLSKLFRNFINGQLLRPSTLCPNCGEKKQSMSLHQQSVLVLGVNSSKPLTDDMGDVTATKKKKSVRMKKIRSTEKLYYIKTDEKKFITPIGARHFFRKMWKNEKRSLQRIFHFLNIETCQDTIKTGEDEEGNENPKTSSRQEQPVDLFFIDTILVPPSKFRPPMSQRGYSFEGPRTAALSNVMRQSVVVQDLIDRMINETDDVEAEKLQPKVQIQWKALQVAVNSLYDNEMDKYGKNKYPGLKQLIDKKEGLFRKNMMGKRVNFAARSVISPDPNILVDQIGMPLVFAKKLTYPEAVTPWNMKRLKEAILNGPDKYPGAVSVVFDDDFTVSLKKENTRQQIASRLSYNPRFNRSRNKHNTHKATIVHRHLLTGDVLLFNRQPTLHKPSIMAFRARVLPLEKGFRLHYANCKSFNADFDGDEMNAHVPQSELARSEAYNIASVNYQYLVPKDGSPLGGLIQDHVVAVCILTNRDQFFEKDRYYQLVYCGLSFLDKTLKLEPPTILKPKQLWTGKQVITTVIKNCIPEGKPHPSLNIKSKIGPKIFHIQPKYEKLSDCHVIIRNGELLVGFMDKSNVGATQYGLIHTCYELYGGETSSNLMSAFSRLATWFLQLYEGFTLGIGDIIVEDDADSDRQHLISKSLTLGPESAKEALSVTTEVSEEDLEDKLRDSHTDRNPLPMKKLDASMKSRTDEIASEISSRCLPEGLIRRFPDNNLQMMIQSGAKGGTVNALQISCLLGQIELEGRRVPLSMSGRSLPSFKPYDTSPKAGGFVTGRFLTGIQPQEFFFHCMAGREGLIDTAVKTSRSGYLQRCLIKHLEGLTVQYDQTVRDSCGSVIQFLYGEDGLDITKCQMLKEKAYPLLVDNHKIIAPSEDETAKLNKRKEDYEDEVIARTNDIQEWLEKNGNNRVQNIRGSGFLDFLASRLSDVRNGLSTITPDKGGLSSIDTSLENKPSEKLAPDTFNVELPEIKESTRNEHGDDEFVVEMQSEVAKPDTDLSEQDKSISASQQSQKRYGFNIGSEHYDQIFEDWYDLSFKEKKKWNKFWELCPDPLISIMNPASHLGVVPEKLDEKIEEFVRRNPQLVVDSALLLNESETDRDRLESYIACDENPELSKSILTHWNQSIRSPNKPKLTKHEFYNLCYNLYIKMLAQAGEAVGLLAAQSIGEPSTQMTLNTFHFAGRGEMNVTLGIPRLREILMTASAKIGTPSMDLPLLTVMRDELGNELGAEAVDAKSKYVRLALNAVRLSDVLEYVDVTEQVLNEPALSRPVGSEGRKRDNRKSSRKGAIEAKSVRYDITFALLPSKYYKHEFKSNSSKVMKFIEEVFIAHLCESMCKRQKRLQMAESMFALSARRRRQETTRSKTAANDNQDLEEKDLDDYNAKVKANDGVKEDESSSDDDEDGEGDNTTQRLRNRRNPDLDYEEPEDDDLEVGDVEANTAQVEEADQEILLDEADESGSPEVVGQESAKQSTSRRRKQVAADVDYDEQVDERILEEQEQDDRPAGQNYELAGFDDTTNNNTRSGFVTPAEEDPELESSDQPSRKRKKLDPSLVAEAVAAADDRKRGKSSHHRNLDQATIERRCDLVKSIGLVSDYQFDVKRERWCKVSICMNTITTQLDMGALLEAEAKRTYVHRVGNIQRALIVKDVNAKSRGAVCDKMIKTEGVSLLSLVRFNDILDLNSIYSNDIHAIANTYGIEAASQAIRREMANVFAVYGIEVDPRHLSLIADYMTYNGSIRGMNRMSMECSASPFQQMSFESTIRYMKWAAILGLYDDIKSPSAALVFGRPARGGTGQFTLLADPAQVERKQHQEELRRQQEFDNSAAGQPRFGFSAKGDPWASPSKPPVGCREEQPNADDRAWNYSTDPDPWSTGKTTEEW